MFGIKISGSRYIFRETKAISENMNVFMIMNNRLFRYIFFGFFSIWHSEQKSNIALSLYSEYYGNLTLLVCRETWILAQLWICQHLCLCNLWDNFVKWTVLNPRLPAWPPPKNSQKYASNRTWNKFFITTTIWREIYTNFNLLYSRPHSLFL